MKNRISILSLLSVILGFFGVAVALFSSVSSIITSNRFIEEQRNFTNEYRIGSQRELVAQLFVQLDRSVTEYDPGEPTISSIITPLNQLSTLVWFVEEKHLSEIQNVLPAWHGVMMDILAEYGKRVGLETLATFTSSRPA